jgi:DNA polymerase-3 subunit epsilon
MFYDTETSNLPLWREPSSDPKQPHIVQAAAILVDEDTRETISSFDLIAMPKGWDIPDEVAKIHGITTELALVVGVPEMHIVSSLYAFMEIAQRRIGHNQPFDARIVRIALKRFADDDAADEWKARTAECTQKLATPIVKAPASEKMKAAGRHHSKTASLSEAYEFFTGKKLEGAHTAMADTVACMDVYWAIKDGGAQYVRPKALTAHQVTAEQQIITAGQRELIDDMEDPQPGEAAKFGDDGGVGFLE